MTVKIPTIPALLSALAITAASSALAQSNFGSSATNAILARQMQSVTAAKGASTQKRLTGYSFRNSGFLTDSGRYVYSGQRGLYNMTEEDAYYGADEDDALFFRPDQPLSVQHIFADSTFCYGTNGTPLHLMNTTFNSYDANNRYIKGVFRSTHHTYANYELIATYNGSGQRLTLQQRDTTHGGVLTDKQEHFYFYDAQNRLILDSMGYIPLGLPVQRIVYRYNSAGQLDTLLLQNNTNNAGFVDARKSGFIYDASGRLLATSTQQNDGNGWFPTFRDTFGYTGTFTNYSYRALQSWNTNTNRWENQNGGLFYTLDIGPNNLPQRVFYKYLVGGNITVNSKTEYFYNSSNLLDSAQHMGAMSGGGFYPPGLIAGYYYEDYSTTAVSALSGLQPIVVYPNPAGDRLYIRAISTGRYTVTGITGQAVLNGAIPAPRAAIDVHQLAPGFYSITLQGSTGELIGHYTFVKQ